jgi:DNA-directed RNA polymerase subunit RPC12/RpoP
MKTTEKIETFRTGQIVCPYCGHIDNDSWEYTESGEVFCGECHKEFYMERCVDIKYTTLKLK